MTVSIAQMEKGSPLVAQMVNKKSLCKARDPGLIPRVRKIRWRQEWQPTPVFLPGEFHGQTMWLQIVGHD